MGVSGYNSLDSGTWHSQQRCSGAVFSAFESMDSMVAQNRGLLPCNNCCDGEWPHEGESDRDPDEALSQLVPKETALKFTNPTWNGPEYIGVTTDGALLQWPIGVDRNVSELDDDSEIRKDLNDATITVEVVDFDGTPLEDYYDG